MGVMNRLELVVSVAAVALLSACGKSGEPPASAPSSSATPPPGTDTSGGESKGINLEELLKREAGELSPRGVKSADSAWTAQALSAADPAVQAAQDGTVVVDIPIGTATPVHCQIFKDAVDPGSTVAGFLAQSAQRVKFEQIVPAGVHVIKRAPAVFLDTLYTVDGASGKQVGNLKIAFYANDRRSILCLHDEGGYRASFAKVSSSFFESFQLKAAETIKPTYLDVSKTSIENMDIGFGVTKVLPGETKGGKTYSTQNTSFIPVSPGEMAIKDDLSIIQVDAQGRMIKGVWVEAEGGELALQIKLTSGPKGGYSYEGSVSGKPVKGEIDAKQKLATPFDTIALMKKQAKSGKAFSQVLNEYHPSLDPTKPTPVTYSRDDKAKPNEVTAKLGEQSLTFTIDETGVPKSAVFPIGNKTLTIVREYVEGTP
jgi:hypothetical protein